MPQNRANYRKNRRKNRMIKRYERLVLEWDKEKLDEPCPIGEFGQRDLTPFNADLLIREQINIDGIKY